MRCGPSRVRSRPSKVIRPPRARSSPEIAASVVVFPAPFAPTSVTICPSGTRNETPLTASIWP